MIIRVNADDLEVDDLTTVATLLQSLGYPDRGIAVAVDHGDQRDRAARGDDEAAQIVSPAAQLVGRESRGHNDADRR